MNPLLLAKIGGAIAKVPWWAWALAGLLAWGALQRHRVIKAREALVEYKAEVQDAFDRQKQADTLEGARRTKTIMEVADAATLQAESDRRSAAGARAALERLRAQSATGGNAGGVNPAATPGGPPADSSRVVPAELLNRCGTRLVELGEYADTARTAGQACERAYDALTKRGPNP